MTRVGQTVREVLAEVQPRTVYLAGPMSGIKDHNIPAFHSWANYLRGIGQKVIDPATWDDINEDGTCKDPWEHYLSRDTAYLADDTHEVDAIMLLPGWERSRGATFEVLVGTILGKTIVAIPDVNNRDNPYSMRYVKPREAWQAFTARWGPLMFMSHTESGRIHAPGDAGVNKGHEPDPINAAHADRVIETADFTETEEQFIGGLAVKAEDAIQCTPMRAAEITAGYVVGKVWATPDPVEAHNDPERKADSARRKATPITTGVFDYFPDALRVVSRISKHGNDKHNPGEPMHHERGKSMDHADCIGRHLLDRGKIDPTTGESHTGNLAWRALALLQEEEEARGAPLARGATVPEDPTP